METIYDTAIVLQVKENPKRPGSAAHGRFSLYRNGMTLAQALEAGVRRKDLHWDAEHGFINFAAAKKSKLKKAA